MASEQIKAKDSAEGVKKPSLPVGTKVVVEANALEALIAALLKSGYKPIGPKVRDGAIVYEPLTNASELPVGLSDDQDGGRYRIVEGTQGSFFEYLVGPYGWRRYLFPQKQKMWAANRTDKGLDIEPAEKDIPSYAFIGVRSCELEAIKIQDKVFGYGRESHPEKGIFSDPGYVARRSKALIVAVNCMRAGKTCFCSSMGGDPHMKEGQGFDLVLSELGAGQQNHRFVVEIGSERGAAVVERLSYHNAQISDFDAVKAQAEKARAQMGRKMVPNVKELLARNLRHERWDEVGKRCLSCGNCTMVCPTCFCTTVEEKTDLVGNHHERWRAWDSCFALDFSYIHGGVIRRESRSRYRQWMTHKLSNWHDQFGSSGCTGCGRCITWCPVGIDITEEARAISESDGAVSQKQD